MRAYLTLLRVEIARFTPNELAFVRGRALRRGTPPYARSLSFDRDFEDRARTRPSSFGLVSVALIRASRRAGVTCYAALWSPDFPLPPKTGAATVWLASR